MLLFEDAVTRGSFSPESLELYAYGVYLMHGGDPDGFSKMTYDDMQILITSYVCTQKRLLDIMFKMLKGVAGISNG